jgi:diaminopimelate epimerase
MRAIKFTKMVATGNDFVVLDNRDLSFGYKLPALSKKLCDRTAGVGADGVLVVQKSKTADFKMRIFNPDGSEPDMCGNGSRCIALFARLRGIAASPMRIETNAGILHAKVTGTSAVINMTQPEGIKGPITLNINKNKYVVYHVNTGVPHAVCFVKDVDSIDINALGKSIRYHRVFAPEGVNFDIVSPKDKISIFMRTYERGVEKETLACGTGAAASAVISCLFRGMKSPVRVFARGGMLKVYLKRKENIFSSVLLEGRVREVFSGIISL